jgi:hypothetical protein
MARLGVPGARRVILAVIREVIQTTYPGLMAKELSP